MKGMDAIDSEITFPTVVIFIFLENLPIICFLILLIEPGEAQLRGGPHHQPRPLPHQEHELPRRRRRTRRDRPAAALRVHVRGAGGPGAGVGARRGEQPGRHQGLGRRRREEARDAGGGVAAALRPGTRYSHNYS